MKKRLLNFLLKHLFNAVTDKDILYYSKDRKKWYKNGREMSANYMRNIRAQAETIKEQDLWKLLTKELKLISNKKMYESSTSVDDMIFGKAMLYSVDVMERKIDSLSKLK